MTSASRIGDVRIRVEGSWDISDLLALSEGLAESYGLFYPLVAEDDQVADRLHSELRKSFWSGDTATRHIGRVLYRQIPKDESLRLKSFSYSSPGSLEIAGIACEDRSGMDKSWRPIIILVGKSGKIF
jgi:hypothetical protein